MFDRHDLARLIRPRVTYANVMSTLALFVALGGGAFAASQFVGSNGVVRLCVTRSGAVKVLKGAQKCGKGKKLVSVNQKGPTGAQGLQGSQGPQGPAGNGSGTSYSAGSGLTLSGTTFSANLLQLQARVGACASDQVLQSVNQAGIPVCVGNHAYFNHGSPNGLSDTATVMVPPGNWVVTAEDSLTQHTTNHVVSCNIDLNGNPATPIGSGLQWQPLAGQDTNVTAIGSTTTTSSSTQIEVVCQPDSSSIDASTGASIAAIPVAGLN